jgi:hypothetical protein
MVVIDSAGTLVVIEEVVELEAALEAGVELDDAGLDAAELDAAELDAVELDAVELDAAELDAAEVGVVELEEAVVGVELGVAVEVVDVAGALVGADEAGVDEGVVITDVVVEVTVGVV